MVIRFPVSGRTRDEIEREVRERLVEFLGDDRPATVELHVEPEVQMMDGTIRVWRAEVEATV